MPHMCPIVRLDARSKSNKDMDGVDVPRWNKRYPEKQKGIFWQCQ